MSNNEFIVVLTTCSSEKEAKVIAKTLIEESLIACANVLPGVLSFFNWQGKLCEEDEVLMMMKSHTCHLDKIVERVQDLHSYDIPEIIALPVVGGSEAYLDWVRQETKL